MKENHLIIIILALMMTSCHTPENEITIIGKIVGKVPEFIEYTVPVNNVSFLLFEESVRPDSLGNFQIVMDIDKASFIELSKSHVQYGVFVAEPGMDYHIFIDTELHENGFRVEAENKAGQDMYNRLYKSEADMEREAIKYIKDSIVSELKYNISNIEKIEIAQFKELLINNVISEDFYNLVKTDREYFYSGVLSMIYYIKIIMNSRSNVEWNEDEFKDMWKGIYQSLPVTNSDFMSSPWFYYYVRNYLQYNEIINEQFSNEYQQELYKQGALQTHKINLAKQFLIEPQLEYYYAAHIKMASFGKNYEKELIELFNQFKEDYPSSKYLPFLEPEINSIVKFHELQDESFGDGIKFIDASQNNDSFDIIIEELKGKKVYFDIWATWCAPCKVEFGHKENLKKLLKTNNIETLYISIDKDERAKQWEDMIKYYDLKGYHIRANEELKKDLTEIIGGRSGIPRYFLVDESGNIVNKMAEPPSRIEKLYKQIIEM